MQNIVLIFNIKLTFITPDIFPTFRFPFLTMNKKIRQINTFLFFKLPSAWWCGVRLRYLDHEKAVVKVKHRWINQNPFRSMFWAVQGMAAELSTGVLMMEKIRESGARISMLVANNKASFTKKATGTITFSCEDGAAVDALIAKAISTGEGQTCWMHAVGINEDNVEVASFAFEWTVKLKS